MNVMDTQREVLFKRGSTSSSSDRINLDQKAKNKVYSPDEDSIKRTSLVKMRNIDSNDKKLEKFDSLNDCGRLEFKKSIFSFQDINYTIEGKRKWIWGPKKPSKHILSDVSGIFKYGLNALMGPSGAGKTSLLNVLGGRKEILGAEGIILLDGEPLSKRFILDSGFVTQEDMLMTTLTIRENIMFSASVRLSSKMTMDKKRQMVQIIIEELDLLKCADSLVGGDEIRGISGGERKRCNIGAELVTIPTILFVDEPTTGLDASTALLVILLLKKLANRGCTVIMTIHQPRYEIFMLFDTLLLLSAGRIAYQGPTHQASNYFKSIGFECEKFLNPADFFLDIIVRDAKKFGVRFNKMSASITKDKDAQDLHHLYENSDYYASVQIELQEICIRNGISLKNERSKQILAGGKSCFATTYCEQFMALSWRTYLNTYRDYKNLYIQYVRTIIYAFMLGSVYLNVGQSSLYGISNRSGALNLIVLDQVTTSLSAIDTFIGERALFIHEATNGFYRVSVYFFAKLLGDLIPMRYIPMLILITIDYWMIGFQASLAKYTMFIFSLLCLVTSGSALVLVFSVSFKRIDIAFNACILYMILLLLLSGYYANVDSLPKIFRGLKYLSMFRYGYNVLMVNEVKDQKYCEFHSSQNNITPINRTCSYGNDFLTYENIPYKTSWDLWGNLVIVSGMTLLFWLISYLQLLRIKKNAKG